MRYYNYFTEELTRPFAIATLVCFLLLVIFAVWFVLMPTPSRAAELYAKSGVVTFVDRTEDRVCFTDRQGEVWEFESADDWEVDDLVACVMSDNGTDEIYDDIVINVKYEG